MFKFELKQLVFYLKDNKLNSARIISRKYVEDSGNRTIRYVTCHGEYDEKNIFESKEELLKSL